MRVYRKFQIEAAHKLPNVAEGHKCARLHGHSFVIGVHVEGTVGEDSGWVIDFADIKRAFEPLFATLDHNYLNDIDGLVNPTSENLAIWVWQRLHDKLAGLVEVTVNETCTSGCSYRGPGS